MEAESQNLWILYLSPSNGNLLKFLMPEVICLSSILSLRNQLLSTTFQTPSNVCTLLNYKSIKFKNLKTKSMIPVLGYNISFSMTSFTSRRMVILVFWTWKWSKTLFKLLISTKLLRIFTWLMRRLSTIRIRTISSGLSHLRFKEN